MRPCPGGRTEVARSVCGWRRRDTGETEEDGEGEEALDGRSSTCTATHTAFLLTWANGLVTGADVGTGGGQKGSES